MNQAQAKKAMRVAIEQWHEKLFGELLAVLEHDIENMLERGQSAEEIEEFRVDAIAQAMKAYIEGRMFDERNTPKG